MARVLVIGLGNVLMQDEGIGVRVVEMLDSLYLMPDDVEVIDGGTAGTELLEPMREAEQLIIADCVNTGDDPGTLVRLADDQVPAFFQTKISNHQLGLSDLLAVLKVTGQEPKRVTIIGMVPYQLENKLGLSDASMRRLKQMLELLLDELHLAGVEPLVRAEPLTSFWAGQADKEAGICV